MTLNQVVSAIIAIAVPIMIAVLAWMISSANRKNDTFTSVVGRIEKKVDVTNSKVDNLSGQLTEHLRTHNGRG